MKRTKIERILCPVDFSGFSVRAYAYATSLAVHYGARLFVQHVVESWQYPSASFAPTADEYEKFCAVLIAESKEKLHSFIQSHAKDGITPQAVVSEKMAADGILYFAKEHLVNLIVMGTHGLRGFERLMLGSVTEKVMRMARCPVLAIPEPAPEVAASATSIDTLEIRRIIACTDFSEISNEALDYAVSVAEEYNANLTLVHVVERVSTLECEEDTANAYKRLDELIPAQTRLGSKITTAVRIGRAYQEIIHFVRENHADLAIMAVRGRNSLDETIFGSTTYRVLQSGACPVLAIRP
jgi:nucleotide-binding universal stress UspA family protein